MFMARRKSDGSNDGVWISGFSRNHCGVLRLVGIWVGVSDVWDL